MKKILLVGIITVFLLNAKMYAGNSDLFTYNQEAIEAEFAQLNALETYVNTYDVTWSELKASNTMILTELHFDNVEMSKPVGMMFGIDDINWTSYAWGLCCWPVGIFTVLLDDDEGNDSKISYFIGVGTFLIMGGGGYGAFGF